MRADRRPKARVIAIALVEERRAIALRMAAAAAGLMLVLSLWMSLA